MPMLISLLDYHHNYDFENHHYYNDDSKNLYNHH
jgi:hypothetical protein